jgi:hypothetical protein
MCADPCWMRKQQSMDTRYCSYQNDHITMSLKDTDTTQDRRVLEAIAHTAPSQVGIHRLFNQFKHIMVNPPEIYNEITYMT